MVYFYLLLLSRKVNYYLMFLLKKGVREEDSKEPQVSKGMFNTFTV